MGVDGLRFWVVAYGSNHQTIKLGPEVLNTIQESIKQIRNALKFILGSIKGMKESEMLDYDSLLPLDKYVLTKSAEYLSATEDNYNIYDYNRVLNAALTFLNGTISGFYFTLIKDRLYCDEIDSLRRRSAQTVLNYIGQILITSVAPIMPHLAEEFWFHYTSANKTADIFFKRGWIRPDPKWDCKEVKELFENNLIGLLTEFNRGNRQTLDKHLILMTDDFKIFNDWKILQPNETAHDSSLTELFRVSKVSLKQVESLPHSVSYAYSCCETDLHYCERCRRHSLESAADSLSLCDRCLAVVKNR